MRVASGPVSNPVQLKVPSIFWQTNQYLKGITFPRSSIKSLDGSCAICWTPHVPGLWAVLFSNMERKTNTALQRIRMYYGSLERKSFGCWITSRTPWKGVRNVIERIFMRVVLLPKRETEGEMRYYYEGTRTMWYMCGVNTNVYLSTYVCIYIYIHLSASSLNVSPHRLHLLKKWFN